MCWWNWERFTENKVNTLDFKNVRLLSGIHFRKRERHRKYVAFSLWFPDTICRNEAELDELFGSHFKGKAKIEEHLKEKQLKE